MVPLRVVVCYAALATTVAAAGTVLQCPGKSIANLNENVQLSPCKKNPCRLKKGTNQHVTVHFTPAEDVDDIKNHVTADVFGVPFPFVGVDGNSICGKIFTENGEEAPCPLKGGTKYIYKDSFPVLEFYPTISVKVHWELEGTKGHNSFSCFEVPVQIVK